MTEAEGTTRTDGIRPSPPEGFGRGSLEVWEADAEAFFRDTGYMRPGKDDRMGTHTFEERCAAFEVWWTMRAKYARTGIGPTPSKDISA